MNKHIEALIIEDNPADIKLVRYLLSELQDYRISLKEAHTLSDGLKSMSENKLDVVILDLGLPDGLGIEVYEKVVKHQSSVPVIIFTGTDGQELAKLAIQSGAQDYLVKGHVDAHLLKGTILLAIERQRLLAERLKAEEILKESLSQKETLLKEIRQRVKNNLELISVMLDLQAKTISDPKYLEMYRETQNRIQSMAMIHSNTIDLGLYIKQLTAHLVESYGSQSRVQVDVETNGINFDLDTSITFGLIVNEIVSNSLKHAFAPDQQGWINITLHKKGDDYVLQIFDNGRGIPEKVDVHNSTTIGIQLINDLTAKLKGTVLLNRQNGAEFVITFPESPN